MNQNTVINADSITTMAAMQNESVDVVVCDPPYPNRQGLFQDTISDGYAGLYLASKKARRAVVFFWSPVYPAPTPPPGWYHTATHVWDKPDCASKITYELIIVWTKDYRLQRYRVWTVPLLDYRSRNDFKDHPTQKPLRLLRYILEAHTKEGDLILDPFAGTGTTAVACKHTNRHYIIIEADHKYAAFAQERLQDRNTTTNTDPSDPPNNDTPPNDGGQNNPPPNATPKPKRTTK